MYNSKEIIFDDELTFLSYNQTINAEFTVNEILNSDLWIVNTDNGLVKAIPLFNCDTIVSSNESDIILDDNKCVILQNVADTLVQCVSNDTGSIHYYTLELYAYAPYTRLNLIDEVTVYCIVYDEYLNTLNDVSVTVLVEDEIISTVNTNNQGICRFKVSDPCTLKFVYDNVESNEITIMDGE